MSESLDQARMMLPATLRPLLDAMIEEYKFAALKVHGSPMYSPKVLAELLLLGWRPADPWINASVTVPPPFTTVLLRVTGGSLHHGEDYLDFGIYNHHDDAFQVNTSDKGDEAVPVSHWMPEPANPAKLWRKLVKVDPCEGEALCRECMTSGICMKKNPYYASRRD